MKRVVLVVLALSLSLPAIASGRVIDMYKSEHCGYCSLWGRATERDRFKMRIHVMNDQTLSTLKEKYSVLAELRSCHTAVAGELIIGGYVPAMTVYQAMQSGSGIYDLATPSMPADSPGMEMGDREEVYDITAFAPGESQNVFQRIEQALITGRRHHPV